jgi:glutathione S-transferase
MKIYNSSTAPNPRRVRVFLAEKGIQVPYEEVDIVKAVNRGPEFKGHYSSPLARTR